jgi:hypothetical protein
MRRERRIDGFTWLVAVGLAWLACLAHAAEVVVKGPPLPDGPISVPGKVTGFSVRKFELDRDNIPTAKCVNQQVMVSYKYELVISYNEFTEAEKQNPPPPDTLLWVPHAGVSFWLNGQPAETNTRPD